MRGITAWGSNQSANPVIKDHSPCFLAVGTPLTHATAHQQGYARSWRLVDVIHSELDTSAKTRGFCLLRGKEQADEDQITVR